MDLYLNCSANVERPNETLHEACCKSAYNYTNKKTKPYDKILQTPSFEDVCEYNSGLNRVYKLQYFTALFNNRRPAPKLNRLVFFNKKNPITNFTIKRFQVTNCSFYGNIRLIQFSRLHEPELLVENFIYNNNHIENVRTSFLNFTNTLTNYVELKNNIVHNFDMVFFNWLLADINTTTLTAPELAKKCKLFIIENNNVFNDDDWYHNQFAATSYYCFVLCEGNKMIYRNNTISGMKSF
jgi:hypothetical protein